MPHDPDTPQETERTEIIMTIKIIGVEAEAMLDRYLRNTLSSCSVSIRSVSRNDNPEGGVYFAQIVLHKPVGRPDDGLPF